MRDTLLTLFGRFMEFQFNAKRIPEGADKTQAMDTSNKALRALLKEIDAADGIHNQNALLQQRVHFLQTSVELSESINVALTKSNSDLIARLEKINPDPEDRPANFRFLVSHLTDSLIFAAMAVVWALGIGMFPVGVDNTENGRSIHFDGWLK